MAKHEYYACLNEDVCDLAEFDAIIGLVVCGSHDSHCDYCSHITYTVRIPTWVKEQLKEVKI